MCNRQQRNKLYWYLFLSWLYANLKSITYQQIFLVAQPICHTLTHHYTYSNDRSTGWQSPLKIQCEILQINVVVWLPSQGGLWLRVGKGNLHSPHSCRELQPHLWISQSLGDRVTEHTCIMLVIALHVLVCVNMYVYRLK